MKKPPDRTGKHHQHRDQPACTAHRGRQSEDIQGHQPAQPREDNVDRVSPRVHKEIHVFGAVVNGVKAPQEG